MKQLFLSSSFCDIAEHLPAFYPKPLTGKRVAFIPTASVVEVYTKYVDNDRAALEQLGLIIEALSIENNSKVKIQSTLSDCDIIYVSGGNTFYLLQELKKSGTDLLIAEEIRKGKLYIGASAGSIILAPDIAYSSLMDDPTKAPELQHYHGLDIIDIYPLPHYGNAPFKEVAAQIYQEYHNRLPIVSISNTQVIEVKGDEWQVKGIPS